MTWPARYAAIRMRQLPFVRRNEAIQNSPNVLDLRPKIAELHGHRQAYPQDHGHVATQGSSTLGSSQTPR